MKFVLLGMGLILVSLAHAQIQVTPATDDPFTPNNLIENVFLGDGVEITNLQFTGVPQAIGIFNNGDGDIDLSRGIVMSTGEVNKIADSSDELNGGATSGGIGDTDLANLVDESLQDLAKYEITFVPISDQLSFRYVFASEEYEGFVCDRFNDVFGFFITGPNPNGAADYDARNIALVPDPADASGLTFTDFPVSTNSINHGSVGCDSEVDSCGDCTKENESLNFSQYYNDNSSSSTFVFDGYSTVLTALIDVIPCQEYTIKLAISDVADNGFSSAVFLEAKSFSSPTLNVARADDATVDGSISEGCTDARFRFTLPSVATRDTFIEVEFITDAPFDIAERGVDYQLNQVTDRFIIDQGSDQVELVIQPILDEEIENEESILIAYQKDICTRDTLRILIRDKLIETIDLESPMEPFCTSGYTVMANDPGGDIATLTPFRSRQLVNIEDANRSYSDSILVDGVEPAILTSGLIAQICIDSLEHRVPEDLDIYLTSPGGQVLELSTDNGGIGQPDLTVFDKFVQTCFTLDATQNINNGDPLAGQPFGGNPDYTGEFLPEGDWNDILNGDNPVNGFWKLTVIDDAGDGSGGNSTDGALRGWSIEFNAPYEVTYAWTLPDGTVDNTISDPTILNTTFTPSVEQTYVLTATDSYGCDFSDEITVMPGDRVIPPENVRCASTTSTSIIAAWDIVEMPLGFEFFIGLDSVDIDESRWVSLELVAQKDTANLEPDTDYVIGVRSIGDGCIGDPVFIVCSTGQCTPPNIEDFSVTDASACRDDGAINVNPVGEGPFTYELNGEPQANGNYENLAAGSYLISIEDATGCSDTLRLEIEKDSFSVEILELQAVGCFGGNGSLIAIPTPGPDVFLPDVSWNNETPRINDINALTLGNIPADVYTIVLTNRDGCEAKDTFELLQPTEITATEIPIVTPLTCRDANDGTISVPISGGTGPYMFSWNDPQSQTDSVAVGLAPGDYTVFVTDSRNCALQTPVTGTIPVNNGFTVLQGTLSPPSCAEGSNGSLSFSNSTGEGPLTWNWLNENNESVNQNTGETSEFSELSAGDYILEVTDVNGCPEALPFTVEEVAPIVVTDSEVIDSKCFDTPEGSISLSVAGGTDVFQGFEWTNVETQEVFSGVANGNSETVSNIPRGNYQVNIQDTNGCPKDTSFTVGSPDAFTIDAVIDTVDCFGEATGGFDITVGGSVGPYSYEWFGNSVFLTDEDPSGLPEEDYAVRITDNVGCIKDSIFFLPQNDKIIPTLVARDVACRSEATGSIQVLLEGGSPGFEFDWEQNGQAIEETANVVESLEPARYTVTITDRLGCVADTSYVVNEPDEFFVVDVIQDTICSDAFEPGSLEVIASGGVPSYTYDWSSGETGTSITSFGGSFEVAVSDQAGCVRTVEAVVEVVETFDITTIDTEAAKCVNTANGVASISLENINYEFGIENLMITDIIWSGLPEEKELSTNMLAGDQLHFVELIDQFGCSAIDSFFIDSPVPFDLTLDSKQDISCFALEDGNINVNPLNGEGPFEFQWSQSTNFQTTQNATELRAGIHAVTITDANGCETTESFEVFEPALLIAEGRSVRARCFGDDSGRIDLLVAGGTPEYRYNWSNQATSENIVNVPLGTYTVTVTDQNDCQIIEEVEVEGPEMPLDIELELIPPQCPGLNTGIIEVLATGGNGFYSYSVDDINFVRNETLVGLVDGEYTVTVRDRNGCSISKDTVIANPEALSLFIGRDTTLAAGQNVFVGSDVRRGDVPISMEPFEFDWSVFPDEVEFSGFDEFIDIQDLQESIIVTLTVTDSLGCMVTSQRRIDVESMLENQILVPTGFTPNGDGSNDILRVLGRDGVTINSYQVFSRWGELVYSSENYEIDFDNESQGWNGNFNGKAMKPDVFVWVVEATFEDGFRSVYRGNTQLIR